MTSTKRTGGMVSIGDGIRDLDLQSLARECYGAFRARPGGFDQPPDPELERRMGVAAILESRGVPPRLVREISGACDHEVRNTTALAAATRWSMLERGQAGREVLVLSGDRGLGKSYAAAHRLARVPMGRLSAWVSATELADTIQGGGSQRSRRDLARIRDFDFIVIDDLGWEYNDRGGHVAARLAAAIAARIDLERRTIITMNMTEHEFAARYGGAAFGAALHDRIRAFGVWHNVETGESMR